MKFESVDYQKLGFELAQEFGEDRFDEPERERFGVYGVFQLVGHGEQGTPFCGRHVSFKGCLNIHLHNIITLDGVNHSGRIFLRKVRFSCGKPSCPVCYKRWAYREAGNIEARLEVSSKRFGIVEHIVASVPVRDYGLDLKVLRAKVIKALLVRGVAGGCLIFHAFRYNLYKHWYFSPHFHVLGHILGGYGRCRRCKKFDTVFCLSCDGFYRRTRNEFKKDGYIVKVLEKRKKSYYGDKPNVFGTALYQLGHASLKKDVKFFHVVTWFGVCSYRKLKVTVELRKDICPICQHSLIWIRYFGHKVFCLDGDSSDYKRDSFEDFEEDGRAVWFECVKRKYGSGSYD